MRQNQSTRSMTALRTAVIGAVVSMTVLAVPYASADTYPDRPITVVVPFDTGGYNDRLARAGTGMVDRHGCNGRIDLASVDEHIDTFERRSALDECRHADPATCRIDILCRCHDP